MPTVITRRSARSRPRPPARDGAWNPREWNPLAQASACALLILLAVFLLAGA